MNLKAKKIIILGVISVVCLASTHMTSVLTSSSNKKTTLRASYDTMDTQSIATERKTQETSKAKTMDKNSIKESEAEHMTETFQLSEMTSYKLQKLIGEKVPGVLFNNNVIDDYSVFTGILMFSSSECEKCRIAKIELEKSAEIGNYQLRILEANDITQEALDYYGVKLLPTIIYLKKGVAIDASDVSEYFSYDVANKANLYGIGKAKKE